MFFNDVSNFIMSQFLSKIADAHEIFAECFEMIRIIVWFIQSIIIYNFTHFKVLGQLLACHFN